MEALLDCDGRAAVAKAFAEGARRLASTTHCRAVELRVEKAGAWEHAIPRQEAPANYDVTPLLNWMGLFLELSEAASTHPSFSKRADRMARAPGAELPVLVTGTRLSRESKS